MNCPKCNARGKIVDSRIAGTRTVVSKQYKYDGQKKRRRYNCSSCDERWSTVEIFCEILPYIPNKKKKKKKPKPKPKPNKNAWLERILKKLDEEA